MKMNHIKRFAITSVLSLSMLFSTSICAFANVPKDADKTDSETDNPIVRDIIDETEKETEKEETEPDREGNPFTVDGNGTLGDEATSADNKQFYTITTNNNNTFYLIIDKDRNSNNVYMLSAIDENDLKDFIETEESEETLADPSTELLPDEDTHKIDITEPDDPDDTETEITDSEKKISSSKLPMILLLVVIAGGLLGGYYILKIRKQDAYDDDEDETIYGIRPAEEAEVDDSDAGTVEEDAEDTTGTDETAEETEESSESDED